MTGPSHTDGPVPARKVKRDVVVAAICGVVAWQEAGMGLDPEP